MDDTVQLAFFVGGGKVLQGAGDGFPLLVVDATHPAAAVIGEVDLPVLDAVDEQGVTELLPGGTGALFKAHQNAGGGRVLLCNGGEGF